MADNISSEQGFKKTQRIMIGAGAALFLVGAARQWPILGKTYVQFIEGEGYLAFMTGLITIILGLSLRLFTDEWEEGPAPDTGKGREKKGGG